jgi:hypothetical protein
LTAEGLGFQAVAAVRPILLEVAGVSALTI